MARPDCSVVIPVYQEARSVPRLHEALVKAAGAAPGGWEFVFVDDGSRDRTWEALCALRAADTRVRAIRFKRNFGQTAAMACGIEANDGGLEREEVEASAVDVAPVSDPRDEDAWSFPINDHAVITDPISKARLRRVDDALGKSQRVKGLQPMFHFPQDAALNVARQLQELGFRALCEGICSHERRALRFTTSAETRPDFREASSEARNAGERTAKSSSISSNVFLSITMPNGRPRASTNRVMPPWRNGNRFFFAPTSTIRSSASVLRSGDCMSGHLTPYSTMRAGVRQTCRPGAAVEESDGAP